MSGTTALQRVQRAARKRTVAEEEYRAALHLAREAGHSYSEIARAADLSRQAVRQYLIS